MGLQYSTLINHQRAGSAITDSQGLPLKDKIHRSEELVRVLNDVFQRGIKVLRVEFTDISGTTCCKMISTENLEELASKLTRGLLFSSSFFIKDTAGKAFESAFKKKYWSSDVIALPDLNTFKVIPWLEDTAAITSVIYHLNMKDLVVEHPRNVVNQQLQHLKSLGFSLMSAYELEFRISSANGREIFADGSDAWGSAARLVKVKDYIKKLFECLPQIGVGVDVIHSEDLTDSLEVSTKPAFGVKAADDAVMCKNACKEIAICNGYIAHFVSDPDWNGTTIHLNHSLWDKSGNVMSNPTTVDLTDTAKYWIAGLLAHARALTPLMAPTVKGIKMFSDYEKLDSMDPSFVTWGRHDRTVTFRVKNGDGPRGSYIENRLGRSDADPYLMLAGTIAAGMDGIINKLPLPEQSIGKEDVPSNTLKLPFDMKEGVTALMQDKVLCDALGRDFVDLLVAARNHEIDSCNANKSQI